MKFCGLSFIIFFSLYPVIINLKDINIKCEIKNGYEMRNSRSSNNNRS